MGWINRLDGTARRYDGGKRTTVSEDGITVEPDPSYSAEDAAAYERGEISDVEYRRRYNQRYHGN